MRQKAERSIEKLIIKEMCIGNSRNYCQFFRPHLMIALLVIILQLVIADITDIDDRIINSQRISRSTNSFIL